jgi:hypothetical protein
MPAREEGNKRKELLAIALTGYNSTKPGRISSEREN